MEWRDQGVLLRSRRHGESSAIIEVFTAEHGLHAGVVRGGAGRKIAPTLQAGAQLDVRWRARLAEHLGGYTVELMQSRAGAAMSDRLCLAGLNAVTSLLIFCLPERESHPDLYQKSILLLDMIGHSQLWPSAYLLWEVALLNEMGFGLNLTTCAVTGQSDGLKYVSPKSGSAVSEHAAGEWADRLLPLPDALLGRGDGGKYGILEGLSTTGFFLKSKLAVSLGNNQLPEARQRLIDLIARQG